MITVHVSPDSTVVYLEPCKPNGHLHQQLMTVGGFFERRSVEAVTVPLSTKAAQELRSILTGNKVSLVGDAGRVLASYADAASQRKPYTVFKSLNENKLIIDAQDLSLAQFSALQGTLNRTGNYTQISDSVFLLEESKAMGVLKELSFLSIPEQLKTSLPQPPQPEEDPFAGVDSVVEKKQETLPLQASEAPEAEIQLPDLPPFSGFDGTLASLKWVPLEAYEYIRSDSEKTSTANRKITTANKNAKTAKQKKKLKRSLAQKLTAFGLTSAFDILHYFPLRHIDRSSPKLIRQLSEGEESAVLGIVSNVTTDYGKKYVRLSFEDMIGDKFSVTFFQQMYLSHMYHKGDQVIVSGKFSPFRGFPSFANAKIDKIGSDRAIPMIPVYSQSEKQELTTWDMLALIKETLGRLGGNPLEEPFSEELRESYRIPVRTDAYMDIHLPRSPKHFEDANRRLVYDELFRLQVMIQKQRQDITTSRGLPQNALETPTVDSWRSGLPYALTGAQERAVKEIRENMSSPNPMYRLIQGDVGAGKSALATFAVLNTLDNGHQSALLAPTEILAEQLFNGLASDVDGLLSPRSGMPIHVAFLGGKTTAAQARKVRAALADGSLDAVVGTHAILTEETTFKDLGTVVIDEQHRFGVDQRSILRRERPDGKTPDMLLMTATPIPRSSAMVLYGDLDLTILDELPPGRTPIKTIWERIDAQSAVNDWTLQPWEDIRNEVRNGHQAYVVASLVEDNEKVAAQSVEDAYQKLSTQVFPEFRMGIVHGKQKRPEREAIMKSFAAGEIDVLIATTVIEVGVNVPNSTVMVVLDPGRFGIAQLHQIRGRVGRSNLPSRCWLVGETKTSDGEFRLNALVESTDGFYLSEKDLELRGEGTLFSTKQSGQGDLYLAKIHEHMDVLETAKNDARALLERDPALKSTMGRIFLSEMEDIFGDKEIKS